MKSAFVTPAASSSGDVSDLPIVGQRERLRLRVVNKATVLGNATIDVWFGQMALGGYYYHSGTRAREGTRGSHGRTIITLLTQPAVLNDINQAQAGISLFKAEALIFLLTASIGTVACSSQRYCSRCITSLPADMDKTYMAILLLFL